MKIKIRMRIGKEDERQARIEPTVDGYIVIYPIPKSRLQALLSGELEAIDLE